MCMKRPSVGRVWICHVAITACDWSAWVGGLCQRGPALRLRRLHVEAGVEDYKLRVPAVLIEDGLSLALQRKTKSSTFISILCHRISPGTTKRPVDMMSIDPSSHSLQFLPLLWDVFGVNPFYCRTALAVNNDTSG